MFSLLEATTKIGAVLTKVKDRLPKLQMEIHREHIPLIVAGSHSNTQFNIVKTTFKLFSQVRVPKIAAQSIYDAFELV